MSDRQRMLDLLRERGFCGVTTFELRRMGISGNPSQRRAELEELGYRIDVKPHREGRRNGRLYVLRREPVEVAAVEASGDRATGVVGSSDLGESRRSNDPGSLFDVEEFKPKRQHDQIGEAA